MIYHIFKIITVDFILILNCVYFILQEEYNWLVVTAKDNNVMSEFPWIRLRHRLFFKNYIITGIQKIQISRQYYYDQQTSSTKIYIDTASAMDEFLWNCFHEKNNNDFICVNFCNPYTK